MRSQIPPIVVMYYDVNKTQINRNGGDSWTPVPHPIFSMPTWHAVVLEKVEKMSNGSIYLIFKDSNGAGTAEHPIMSQIRMRAEDAPDLITQVLAITGPWDNLNQ